MGGKMLNLKGQSDKKSKNIIGIIQSCLILVLVILIIFMMIQISWLQGTARVINYAGLVRGATQREVKLEITENRNEELMKYLDDILSGLRYQDGHYELVKLYDKEYQEKLKIQSDYWEKLKTEIEAVRSVGYENTDIVNMSEIYFKMADETVFAAEKYSEKIATKIRTIEILSAFDMLCLVILVIVQTLMAMKMAVKNKLLEHRAYTDAHTGLPNKSACKELLGNKEIISEPTACIMFDLNNLKTVNDTMGHSAGDQLILNFARLLRNVIPEKDFVGRYGGDEFVLVLPEIKEDGLVEKLQEIQEKIQNAVIPGYSNIQLSVSMGAVISQNESVEHAMLRAHKLMYQAKNKKNMAITENNMIDHEGKIHAQKQPEKMIPEILVVDDEEVNRTLLDTIFSKDYHVLQTESGEKCIEILEQQVNSISLVLLDVVLPKMDGFDVLTYMNKNHWIEDIPVIMMSGADAPEAVKRAYALGAVDFVSKPCDAQIVYQRVTNTMKLYAKQRRLTSLITAQINEKEKNSEMLIHILSHIVEFRNGESGSHVLHIHKLTEMLLERLAQKTEKYHLDGDTRAMIALASSLHDIGKIGVDEKILNKPGKLTKEEFEIMKTHTVIGAEMLEQLLGRSYPEDPDKDNLAGYSTTVHTTEVNRIIALNFILKASLIYGAIVLMVMCLTVLALQQLLDAEKNNYRFSVLRKMGVEEKDLHTLVLKQLGVWFGMPITAAIVVAIIVIGYFLQSVSAEISAYIGCGALMVQVGIIIGILFLLLICYFISTWILFKRSISEN